MALPTFRSLAARRQEERVQRESGLTGAGSENSTPERTSTPSSTGLDLKRATPGRRRAVIVAGVSFFLSFVFLILTFIGNINKKPVIRSTYFFKLDLSNIIPASTPADISFVNSLARSLGLHDFYQVGLWNFCEGYNNEGITYCSRPRNLYWFNPVEIILSELLAGATIALPAKIVTILTLIKIVSHLMFAFFLIGLCMTFISIFLTPLALRNRWWSGPIAAFASISALLTTVSAIIATVMFIIFQKVITSQAGLNIGASLGVDIFVFMWMGTVFKIIGSVIHLSLACTCCCARRRAIKTGTRKNNKAARADVVTDEKKSFRRRYAGSRFLTKTAGEVV